MLKKFKNVLTEYTYIVMSMQFLASDFKLRIVT